MKKTVIFIIAFILYSFGNTGCYSQETTKYENLKKRIAEKRQYFSTMYAPSDTIKQKQVIREAQDYLTTVISDSLFSYWYGTPWNFNGTTKVPKQGSIACGFFVTWTAMLDSYPNRGIKSVSFIQVIIAPK